MRQLLFLCLTVAVQQGCASFKPSSVPAPPAVPEHELTSSEGFAASIDPYWDAERQKTIFSADLNGAGVLAIRVIAMNRSEEPVLVRRTDMFLALPDGTRLGPISGHAAAVLVGEGGNVVGMTLAFGFIGGLVASNAEDSARAARIEDYQSKEFKDTTLDVDQSAHGFVYFAPPKDTFNFNETMLEVRFVDPVTAAASLLSVPVKNVVSTGSSIAALQEAAYHPGERSISCPDIKNLEQPWVGRWLGKHGDATLSLEIGETKVHGKFELRGKTYRVGGTIDNSGYVLAVISPARGVASGYGNIDGFFPELRISNVAGSHMGRLFQGYEGQTIRVCS